MSDDATTTIRCAESPWGWVFLSLAVMSMATCEMVTFSAEIDERIAKMRCVEASE